MVCSYLVVWIFEVGMVEISEVVLLFLCEFEEGEVDWLW